MKSQKPKELKITNPATGVLIKKLKCDSSVRLRKRWNAIVRHQREWSGRSLEVRKASILKFRNLLERDLDVLARVLTTEMGKPIQQSENEIRGTLKRIDFFLNQVNLSPRIISDSEEIRFEPLGIIGNISAWNYPYFVGVNVFIPALLTGNSVIYKPSEYATLTGVEIAKRLWESGVPKNAFTLVIGGGLVGKALLDLPLNGIFFTGSYKTGRQIANHPLQGLTKKQLELGGKDPIYVCEDVDINKAAAGIADGAFYNAGQGCCSVERIYVHKSIYQEFVSHFVAEVKKFVVGDPLDRNTYIGPLARREQLKLLKDQVRDAIKKGAKLETGGETLDRTGNFFAPTVFSRVNHTMRLMTEESFGPIIGIQAANDDLHAIKLMNDTDYGLTAGVYTPNRARAEAILNQLNVGTVYWNCCDRVTPGLPWSGRKHSGIGVTLSTLGIETFLVPKAWHLTR